MTYAGTQKSAIGAAFLPEILFPQTLARLNNLDSSV